MSRKIFIKPLKSLDDFVEQNRADAEAKAIEEGKAILRISGDSIHIRAKDGYGVITHDFLCGGIIFNTQGYYPLDIEFNGAHIIANSNQIVCTPAEFILDEERTTAKSLDWSGCLRTGHGRYKCEIDIDSNFSIDKLQYRCIRPVVVRVGRKAYRYAKPILQDIIYKGRKYPVLPIRKNYPITNNIIKIR
jgi:hypothetical protein